MVLEAARMASCDEFIEKLPNGYMSMAGDSGKKLSGGERQRITLARAILKDAPIIILDEATASVDPENEAKINETIDKIIAGMIAALMSAFLNNQVVAALMLVICRRMATRTEDVDVKDITLPVIYFVILGGQCTLIGAPATLMASSISAEMTGYKLSFFELLPIGGILFILGMIYIYFFGYKKGVKIWGDSDSTKVSESVDNSKNRNVDKRKCIITLLAGIVMLVMFITEIFSAGMVSLIGALICLLGGVVEQKKALSYIDWNILIWLACSIGMANALNSCGVVQKCCERVITYLPKDTSPYVFLIAVVLLTTIISNLIANTTTVIMLLPFTIQIANQFG